MFLNFFWDLIVFIITLGILICVHEYGHFLAARFFKVHVERFSIGFGPILWHWKSANNTEYVISAIFLGGYVKLLDTKSENVDPLQSNNNSLYSKSIWQRSIITIAGPFLNFIFSILLYTLVYSIGVPVYQPIINYVFPNSIAAQSHILMGSKIQSINNIPVYDWDSVRFQILSHTNNKKKIIIDLQSNNNNLDIKTYSVHLPLYWFNQSILNTQDPIIALGILPNILYVKSTAISEVNLDIFSIQNNLKVGDKILLINKQPIYNWESCIKIIKNYSKPILQLTIERNNQILYANILLYKKGCIDFKQSRQNTINLLLDNIIIFKINNPETYQYKLHTAILKAINKTWNLICFVINSICRLISGDNKVIVNIQGPIRIAQVAGELMHSGLIYYLMFLAIISINLGVVNLIPFPILDGGQLLFLLIEKIKGSPISKKMQDFSYIISFVTLTLIMFLALYNDITKQ